MSSTLYDVAVRTAFQPTVTSKMPISVFSLQFWSMQVSEKDKGSCLIDISASHEM